MRRSELALLTIPSRTRIYDKYGELCPSSVGIDATDYGLGWRGESFYVAPGERKVKVYYMRRPGLFEKLFNPLAGFDLFLPTAHLKIVVEKGERYILRARQKGIGSCALYFHWFERERDGAVASEQPDMFPGLPLPPADLTDPPGQAPKDPPATELPEGG